MVTELFRLGKAETGILSQDAYPDMSATYPKFTELYRYQVPVDRQLVFKPGHTFSLLAKYLNENLDAIGFDDATVLLVENMATINEEGSNAVISPATVANADYSFFGYRYKFKSFKITGAANMDLDDSDADSQWDYWGGSWIDLPGLTDGTNGLSNTTVASEVSWTLPGSAWVAIRNTGPLVYLVRRVVAGLSSGGDATTVSAAAVHDDETMDNRDLVKIEVRDQNEQVRRPLIDALQYRQVSEFTDRDKVARLTIAEPVIARPGDWVVISVKAIAPVDVSNCYFDLTCDRETVRLF